MQQITGEQQIMRTLRARYGVKRPRQEWLFHNQHAKEQRKQTSFLKHQLRRDALKTRNVVCIRYTGDVDYIPSRELVGKRLLKESLGLSPRAVFALVHLSGTREFDISLTIPQYLDRFWKRYQEVKMDQEWNNLQVIPVSQPEVLFIGDFNSIAESIDKSSKVLFIGDFNSIAESIDKSSKVRIPPTAFYLLLKHAAALSLPQSGVDIH
ncbi:UNVERIFIED_CONTAM: hypothetical protein FKN15_067311 [Acipenser sinensis]